MCLLFKMSCARFLCFFLCCAFLVGVSENLCFYKFADTVYCENDAIDDLQNLDLTRVTNISWQYSTIRFISPGAFNNTSTNIYLSHLSVQHTNLTVIVPGVFSNLACLRLILSGNQINIIDNGAFYNIVGLTELRLGENALTKFNGEDIVGEAPDLTRLFLGKNWITTLNEYSFRGMTNLKYLDLSHNLISTVEDGTFAETPFIVIILLSSNRLKNLNPYMFAVSMYNFKLLNVAHNRLQYLSFAFLSRIASLEVMNLIGNPWSCPCLDLVLRFMNDNDVNVVPSSDDFKGKRPICVSKTKVCIYRYDKDTYELYTSASKLYN